MIRLRDELDGIKARPNALRFSLAGAQLKFSAFKNDGKGGGLTIPVEETGRLWIVRLPLQQYSGEDGLEPTICRRLLGNARESASEPQERLVAKALNLLFAKYNFPMVRENGN